MAKIKKPRNKKYISENARRRTITRSLVSMLGSMFFIGDNRHAPACFAESKLQQHVKSGDLIQARASFRDLLVFSQMTWGLLVFGFVKRGDKVEVVTGSRVTEEISGLEFFSNFVHYVHETLHEVLDASNIPHEELHSYGYFANMCDIYNMDMLEPNLIDRFFRNGLGEDRNNLDVEELVGFEDFIKSTSRVFKLKVVEGEIDIMTLVSQHDIVKE